MNIKDIPSLMHAPGSPASWSLDVIPVSLERWSKSYGVDLDPDFQRGHVWEEKHQIKFIEFIVRGGTVPPIRFNSPAFGGHTHAKHSDLPETLVVVDGKQRLTAILKFIDNKLPIFDGNYLDDFDKPHQLLLCTDIQFLVNKLQTKKELVTWYLELNEGQIAHTPEELDRIRAMAKAL